jgi:Ca2+-binding RTX toxin-like protein
MTALDHLRGPLGPAAATTLVAVALAAGLTGTADASPARATATLVGGALVVDGSPGEDTGVVDFTDAGTIGVELNGVRQGFARAAIRTISVSLRSGDDRFSVTSGRSALTDLPLRVDGGNGDDHLLGGAAADVLSGDRGDDFVDGGVGADTQLLGPGDDVASWDPGEGSDATEGGSGRDTLVFNGAGGDETMSLSADGSSAVFLRSPGSIRMDLDEVERLEVDARGGADAVTVGDLTGTGLEETTLDLGSSDEKVDTVALRGTEGSDDVSVTSVDGGVDVAGLRPRTRIEGSEPSDRLEVGTLGGADAVRVSDAASALISVLVDLGVQ